MGIGESHGRIEYLWPVHNVPEYAYCPRLFYLMEVEAIHLGSEDTEQGTRPPGANSLAR